MHEAVFVSDVANRASAEAIILRQFEAFVDGLGRQPTEQVRSQALMLEGSRSLANRASSITGSRAWFRVSAINQPSKFDTAKLSSIEQAIVNSEQDDVDSSRSSVNRAGSIRRWRRCAREDGRGLARQPHEQVRSPRSASLGRQPAEQVQVRISRRLVVSIVDRSSKRNDG